MQMYGRIISGKIRYPGHVDAKARSLLSGLLNLRPSRRLGGGRKGSEAIKCHEWFDGFDWEALLWKKLQAPLVPTAEQQNKLSNFASSVPEPKVIPYTDDGTAWDKDF